MENMYDRLGDILRDRLANDDDPFDSWNPHQGRERKAGNNKQRKPAPIRAAAPERVAVPPELVEDFRILGLLPGVTPGECRDAWKMLMKKHHPDKNNQSSEATLIATRINNSYNRIMNWYKTGEVL